MKAFESIRQVKTTSGDIVSLVEAYEKIGKGNAALSIKQCSNVILSRQCQNHLEHQSVQIQYCKNRFCPICTVHRSYMLGAQLKTVVDEVAQNSKGHWLFLTLTIKNVYPEELGDAIGHMMKSWQRLSQRKQVRSVLRGWFRGLEVTSNERDHTFHPHFHVLIYVRHSYFTGKYYVKQDTWAALWKESLQVDYTPIVDIRRVKSRSGDEKDILGAVLEVTKYPMKFESIESVISHEYFDSFEGAMFRRRSIAFGGMLKKSLHTVKQVHQDSIEQESEDHVSECRVCGGTLATNFVLWNDSAKMYQSYS